MPISDPPAANPSAANPPAADPRAAESVVGSAQRVTTGRLAPSPTGAQHLGNARTYLLAWLAARSAGGRVVLRIEDIDSPRVKGWATAQAISDLRWLGLDWDEGPDVGGPHGPYIQSERESHYQAALERLVQQGLAYPCTCTRKDIEAAASAPHETPLPAAAADPAPWLDGPIYPRLCAGWQPGDALPAAGTYCWRFRAPDRAVRVADGLCGSVCVNPAAQLGDFPLTRKNGQAAYQLAVVVDDAAMNITEIVRGEDLLPSVFRQLPLIAALDLPQPNYFHVPLVTGLDGRRLAKRHGDTRLEHYRVAGISPQRIVGWALHSLGVIDQLTPLRPADALGAFHWSRVRRGATAIAAETLFAPAAAGGTTAPHG